MRPFAFSLAACLIGLSARAEPPAPTLQTAVREAVANRQVLDSELKGPARAGEPFRATAADGGVLVGLEVGLGRAGGAEYVRCVRPVYRAGEREWAGPPAGDFLAAEVARTQRAVAGHGYVVRGILVNAGERVDGLRLVFHRVRDGKFEPNVRYPGALLGTEAAVPADWLDGEHRPVVGLFGRVEAGELRALGVTFADLPRPVRPGPPAAPEGEPSPRPPSNLEVENAILRAARAARAAVPDESGGLGWVLGLAALSLVAGAGFIGFRARRGRARARRAHAEPAPRPALPLRAQWAPIRPGSVLLKGSPGAGASEADGSDKPPSIPAGLLRPGSAGADVVWR